MHNPEQPVLIVGAGPTGLTAAMELSRLGVPVRIVDKTHQASPTSRALGIQARTVELLHPRGVGDEMLELGNRAGATALYSRGKKLAAIQFHRMSSRYNFLLLLAQSETERLLTKQLARQGVKVERDVELVSFAQDEDGVQAVLCSADGSREIVDAAYLIAADGAHSPIRKALGLPFDGRALEHRYLLGDVHIDGDIPHDQLSIFLARDRFLAVFPMGANRFRFMATDPAKGSDGDPDPTLDELQHVVARVCHLPARVHDLNWSSRFRINSRHMSTLRAGRVFFGGDAAHVHSPAGGQGMNAGIQDMINLCWKLAMVHAGTAEPALLDTYETDRLPVIRQLVRMTERATTTFNSTNPVTHQVLTRALPMVLGRSAVQDRAAPRLGQIAASYRRCPVAAGGGRIGMLHAGDRMPDLDVLVCGSAGFTRLYDALDLGRLTLVLCGGEPDDAVATAKRLEPWRDVVAVRHVKVATGQRVFRGPDAEIATDLAAGPCLVLVRPDGYVAAAAEGLDPSTVISWLQRWFIPQAAALSSEA